MESGCARSGWLGADRIFTLPELQRRFDDVEISVFTPKFTMVPANFFRPEAAREILSQTVTLAENDQVSYVELPQFGAVAIFSVQDNGPIARVLHEMVLRTDGSKGRLLPEQYLLLEAIDSITDYNKIVVSYADGCLYLVVAQGRTLLLCNSYEASDFTTAEYFIFMVMKKFQLNPEVSTIFFRTPVSRDDEVSLYNYFRSVEFI